MTRVVESIVPEFGDRITWQKVITKELKGAMRFGELSKTLKRPAPVPAIFINGHLVFEQTPGPEELRSYLEKYMAKQQQGEI